jgi:hypothetical protein
VLVDLDSTHKLWRGIAFRDKVANLKVCNISRLLGEPTWWRSDPVHPTVEGYNRVDLFIMKGFRAMITQDEPTDCTAGGDSAVGSSKRALEADVFSAPKRPAWLRRSESYVTRRESGPFQGARGGGGGGSG